MNPKNILTQVSIIWLEFTKTLATGFANRNILDSIGECNRIQVDQQGIDTSDAYRTMHSCHSRKALKKQTCEASKSNWRVNTTMVKMKKERNEVEAFKYWLRLILQKLKLWYLNQLRPRLGNQSLKKFQFEENLKNLVKAISSLIEQRLFQVGSQGIIPNDVFELILRCKALNCISNVDKSYHLLHQTYLREKMKNIKDWNDIISEIFVNMLSYDLISKHGISILINQKTQSHYLTNFITSKLLSSVTVTGSSLDFNFRLSALHSPLTRDIHELLGLLIDETWNSMEFEYLKYQLSEYKKIPSFKPSEFYRTFEQQFIELGSPSMKLSKWDVFEYFLNFAPSKIFTINQYDDFQNSSFLTRANLSYKMISYIIRNFSNSDQWKINSDQKFIKKIKLIEDAIGITSSIIYSASLRYSLIKNRIGYTESLEFSKKYQLFDFQHHSSLHENLKDYEILKFYSMKDHPVLFQNLVYDDFKELIKTSIQNLSTTEYNLVQSSIEKCLKLNQRYETQRNSMRYGISQNDDDFLKSFDSMKVWALDELHKVENTISMDH